MCVWVKPRPHTHTKCGLRFPPQYHISYNFPDLTQGLPHEDVCGNGGRAPWILHTDTRWKCVVVIPLPLYPRINIFVTPYPLDRKLNGWQWEGPRTSDRTSEKTKETKVLVNVGTQSPVIYSITSVLLKNFGSFVAPMWAVSKSIQFMYYLLNPPPRTKFIRNQFISFGDQLDVCW